MRKDSELTLAPDGTLYHIHLNGDMLADDVLLVGDPSRIAIFRDSVLEHVECETHNRELFSVTGLYHGHRFTALSTGMGCDNIDIVVSELDAAANIDLATGDIKPNHRTLNLVRLGTCGSLQPEADVESLVASRYAIGLDGLLHYYQHDDNQLEAQLADAFCHFVPLPHAAARPYAASCSKALLDKVADGMVQGITATAGGFYAPQGRNLRIAPAVPDLPNRLSQFSWNGNRIINFEMETSAIYGLSALMGHQALTVCLVIANRSTGRFLNDYHRQMRDAIALVMERLA